MVDRADLKSVAPGGCESSSLSHRTNPIDGSSNRCYVRAKDTAGPEDAGNTLTSTVDQNRKITCGARMARGSVATRYMGVQVSPASPEYRGYGMKIGEIEIAIGTLIDRVTSLEDLVFVEDSIKEMIQGREDEIMSTMP